MHSVFLSNRTGYLGDDPQNVMVVSGGQLNPRDAVEPLPIRTYTGQAAFVPLVNQLSPRYGPEPPLLIPTLEFAVN